MPTQTATFNVQFNVLGDSNVGVSIKKITAEINGINQSVQVAGKNISNQFSNIGNSIKQISFSSILDQIDRVATGMENLAAPGLKLSTNMAELSAITGVTGKGLQAIEDAARSTSKTFGTDASANVESYKLILSQLDPEIAKNSKAMKMMGENVNILSKQMGGDTVAATNVLTTSMNQFGVSTKDPIQAAKTMADMMNVMSAGAQAGSAELPQIQQALEQVGMVAKTTGLSFVETNAQIQVLDKAGKKGSEGGVALRNVLTTLSEGRFASKDATNGLKAAGISVEYLANQSIPLTDRLRTLRKIQGDTALMTKVFGKENMAAGIAMIQGADYADQLSKGIAGTNSAMEQAAIIMESPLEKNKRLQAQVDDFKISLFNATGGFLGYASVVGNTMRDLANIAPMFQILGSAITFVTNAEKMQALWTNIVTASQWALNAAMYANPVGIVVAAIVALVAVVVVAIKKYDSWGASILALMGPFGLIINAVKSLYDHWQSVKNAFETEGIAGGLRRLGVVVLDAVLKPLQQILETIDRIAGTNWAATIRSIRQAQNLVTEGEAGYVKKTTVNGRTFIGNSGTDAKYIATMKDAEAKGFKGGEGDYWAWKKNYDKQQAKNNPVFDVTKGTPATGTIGGVAAKKTKEKKEKEDREKGDGNKTRSLNINKLIENLIINNQNGTTMSKEAIIQMVKEALLTAAADFTLGEG